MRLRVRNPNDRGNGCDIGDRRSSIMRIVTGMLWTLTGGPEMLRVVVIAVMFFVPAIGIAMGVVIWVGLDTQGG